MEYRKTAADPATDVCKTATSSTVDVYGGRVPPKGMIEKIMKKPANTSGEDITLIGIGDMDRGLEARVYDTTKGLFTLLRAKPKITKSELQIVLIDTSYINSIVTEEDSVKMVLTDLKSNLQKKSPGGFEIIMTRQIYDELTAQLDGPNGRPRCNELGRYIFTSNALNELHETIYGCKDGTAPILKLEEVACSEETRQEICAMLEARNRKGNKRIGAGDASIVQYIRDLVGLGDITFQILTRDTDFQKLMRGCSTVRVLKWGYSRQKLAVAV
jgi:hypothetical protein